MRYFQRLWEESPEADWGCSWWYFETDDAGNVARQIEWYYNGPLLRYDEATPEDEQGSISKVALDLGDFASFTCPQERFERVWTLDRSLQRGAFADFLEHLALNQQVPGEWAESVSTHYFDKPLEDIRREVARLYIEAVASNEP